MLSEVMDMLSRMAWSVIHAYVLILWNMVWPLAVGFLLSAWVRTRVPASVVTASLGRNGPGGIVGAAVFGIVSSVCNYAVVGMGKTLRDKGATWPNTLLYMLASTNLGITMLLTVYGFLGLQMLELLVVTAIVGMVLIWILSLIVLPGPVTVTEKDAKPSGKDMWLQTAVHFYDDLSMTRRDILVGLGVAALAAALVPASWWRDLFMQESVPSLTVWLWNAVLGVVLAFLTFGCSIGNVALAAVLWWNGVSPGGVMAFLMGSLLTLPMLHIYWRQYGTAAMWKLAVIMAVGVIVASMAVDAWLALEGIKLVRLHPGMKTPEGDLLLLVLNILFGVVGWAFYWAGSQHSTMKGMMGMGGMGGMNHDMSGMHHDMGGMNHDMGGMKHDMPGMGGMQHDMSGMKHDMSGMQHAMPDMKQSAPMQHDMSGMKHDMPGMKQDMEQGMDHEGMPPQPGTMKM